MCMYVYVGVGVGVGVGVVSCVCVGICVCVRVCVCVCVCGLELVRQVSTLQVVAVDLIFSSRIKSVCLEPIFGPYQWRAGPGLFLTIWRSLGGSLGEQVVSKKKKKTRS